MRSRIFSPWLAAAAMGGGLLGYLLEGPSGALVAALALVGAFHASRSLQAVLRSKRGRPLSPESVDLPPQIASELRDLAHDLRAPIAAATAAFAVFDEQLGDAADEEHVYLRGVVRRNLEKAEERLRALERRRLGAPSDDDRSERDRTPPERHRRRP